MINTVSRDICKIGPIKLGLLIFLKHADDSSYAKFKLKKAFRKYIGQGGYVSLTYDFPTFMVIDYTGINGTYVKDHKMFIPVGQIIKLERFLSKTLRVVEDKEGSIFYLDASHGNKLSMYTIPAERMKDFIIREVGFSGNHILQSNPTIVTDYQENLYEGAAICIDRRDNVFNLSYDELSAFWYIVSRTDFVNLAQAIVNSTLLWANTNITKHLDIDTTRAIDYKQKGDIKVEEERSTQPIVQLGNNVFSNLVTKE